MSVRALALLFCALAVFHCLGNWAMPLLDRDEPRFAEASREMRQSGDYVVPHFNGADRFDKPPLIYWLQCGAYALLGENEFAARLPSALCAAAIGVALAAWGAQLWGPATGWRAALIFSLCLQTMIHARAAVADMPMVLCATLAAWAGWVWRTRGSRFAWAAFWMALALGFLAKGPIALLPLGMVWWGGATPARRSWGAWLGGAAIMLGMIALWGVPALVRTNGAYAAVGLGKHVVARSFSPLEGHGGGSVWSYLAMLLFYFGTIWLSFFPWSIWLPAAARAQWQAGFPRGSIERYLFAGVLLCFGIFTLSRTKLPHYTLPCFPFLALLLAARWPEKAGRAFHRTALATAVGGVLLFLAGFAFFSRFFPGPQLYAQAAPFLKPETRLITSGYQEPSLVWIFRKRLLGYAEEHSPAKLCAALAEPDPCVAILPESMLSELPVAPDAAWPQFRAEGMNFVNARKVRLVMIVKPQTQK